MRSRRTGVALATVLLLAVVSACSGDKDPKTVGNDEPGGKASTSASAEPQSAAQITSSIAPGSKNVKVNRMLRLDVTAGTFSEVSISSKAGKVEGALSADRASWQNTSRLQPGALYRVRGIAVDESGEQKVYKARFRTAALALDKQTYPSFFPTAGSTVGVGLPVIIRFDVPVTNHAALQRHITVTSTPAQTGAFHWISDKELHWRPAKYWKPGTKVTVDADIDSVPAGNGVFGQESRKNSFTIGRSLVSKVNMKTHQMKVFKNGKLIRTLPITTGEQPKFTTRSGTKVIIEKFRHKRMNSETIGIDPNSADGYDLDDVEYAMRLTYSGEFVHAAPWSVGQQGRANVSHGCTGMSTANAGWFYGQSIIGDVIEYTGTTKQMTLENGFGDWNLPIDEYAQGSAL
ncbi:lipoprotein-anchoring transpeptidase ErfK/SrfK [Marmoricola sp. OAE513]|uniref:L,D-transpeptidase n=1 Tax=Marmoricola sp. OAE513 TaxID=2817894 RepID=UPI001AEB54DD